MKSKKRIAGIIPVVAAFCILLIIAGLCCMAFFVKDMPADQDKGEKSETVYETTMNRDVLFISSYSIDFESFEDQYKGLKEEFSDNGVNLDVQFMDMKTYDTEKNKKLFYKTIKYKLKHHDRYDGVILGDDAALHFGYKYHDELFEGIPMVFFGINDTEFGEEAAENRWITGTVEKFYLTDTIKLALKFQPEATKLHFIVDDSDTGKGDRKQAEKVKKDFPGLEADFLDSSELTRDELGMKLSQYRLKEDIVIFLTNFYDSQGNFYSINESVKFIRSHSNVPVYRTSVGGIGNGLIGGKILDFRKMGADAADIMISILDAGDDSEAMAITEKGVQDHEFGRYCIDAKIMEKYGFDTNLLPEGTDIINKKPTMLTEYKKPFIVTISVLSVFAVLLILAEIEIAQRKKRANELQKSYDKLVEKEKELDYMARHDMLTGLRNRRTAMQDLKEIVKNKEKTTVIIMNIDDFKLINDGFGHSCGDFILRTLSKRIRNFKENRDIDCFRFGGDEFMIIFRHREVSQDSPLIDELMRISEGPVQYQNVDHFITMSAGAAYYDPETEDSAGLYADADMALSFAKNSGKNKIVFYDVGMKRELERRNHIKTVLENALDREDMYMVYQPQVDLKKGKVHSFEALVRFRNCEYGPADFIPIAEEGNLVIVIGRMTTRLVIRQVGTWIRNGYRNFDVSINYSSRQINDTGYVDYLKALMDEYDVPADYVEIEITESLFLKNDLRAKKVFDEFEEIGVRLALDDFGSGFSSINYLTYIPVHKIKIDKSLVDKYLLKDSDEDLVRDIVNMAHTLNIVTTVEGVEEEWQAEKLKKYGCEFIQGYFYSKPVEVTEVNETVKRIEKEWK